MHIARVLLLCATVASLGVPAAVSAAERPAQVLSYGTYRDGSDNIVVFGNIKNANPFPCTLHLTADGLSGSGAALEADGQMDDFTPVLPANATVPFSITVTGRDGSSAPKETSKFRFHPACLRTGAPPVMLQAKLGDAFSDNGRPAQRVVVTNSTHTTVHVQVVAIGKDASGKVIDVQPMYSQQVTKMSGADGPDQYSLAAGEVGSMYFYIKNPTSAASWTIWASGVKF